MCPSTHRFTVYTAVHGRKVNRIPTKIVKCICPVPMRARFSHHMVPYRVINVPSLTHARKHIILKDYLLKVVWRLVTRPCHYTA